VGRAGIELLQYLMDQAFEDAPDESLMGNLRSLGADDWDWRPPGGERSVRQIVQHVGSCKLMYDEYAFGPGLLTWDNPAVVGVGAVDTPASGIAWLREMHHRLRQSVDALADDAELRAPRRTNWGELKETRWLLSVLIQHDNYHAGEINHLRALRQNDDAWQYPLAE
jgi:uncharacterized damage-inducible protein DinB